MTSFAFSLDRDATFLWTDISQEITLAAVRALFLPRTLPYMKRWLKRIGIGILAIILLVIVAIGTAYALVGRKLARKYPTEVAAIAVPTDSASVARGQHLSVAVAKCAACHGDNLGGKKVEDSPAFGRLYAANLTTGNGGVGAGYTDADWVRGIRHGLGTDGRPLVFMPSQSFHHMTDADLGQIIAYLKTIEPVDYTPPERKLGVVARVLHMAVGFPFIASELMPTGPINRTPVTPAPTAEYGKYLTKIGSCEDCHGASLSGGGGGPVPPPNITPTGLRGWSEADFVKAMRTGVRPGGRVLSVAMPWPYIGKMTDDELRASWLYLQSVPPKKTGE